MLHPSYTDLMKAVNCDVELGDEPVVNSRYSIVIATARRARQLISGDEPMVPGASGKKPFSVAVEELYRGQVKILPEDALDEGEGTDEEMGEEMDEAAEAAEFEDSAEMEEAVEFEDSAEMEEAVEFEDSAETEEAVEFEDSAETEDAAEESRGKLFLGETE